MIKLIRPIKRTIDSPISHVEFKTPISDDDFECPHCGEVFDSEDYEHMKQNGECYYCEERVYPYTVYYWTVFFSTIPNLDDPVWLAERLMWLRTNVKGYIEPEAMKVARSVGWSLGRVNAVTHVLDYMKW